MLRNLGDEYVNRPLRAKSKKVNPSIALNQSRLAWRTIREYVTAITDLYRYQTALVMNTRSSPREDSVRECIKFLQRRDAEMMGQKGYVHIYIVVIDTYTVPHGNFWNAHQIATE